MNTSALLRQAQFKSESRKNSLVNKLTQANFNVDSDVSFAGVDTMCVADAIRTMSQEQVEQAFKLLADKKSKKGKFIKRNNF